MPALSPPPRFSVRGDGWETKAQLLRLKRKKKRVHGGDGSGEDSEAYAAPLVPPVASPPRSLRAASFCASVAVTVARPPLTYRRRNFGLHCRLLQKPPRALSCDPIHVPWNHFSRIGTSMIVARVREPRRGFPFGVVLPLHQYSVAMEVLDQTSVEH